MQPASTRCSACGGELRAGARFCTRCGTPAAAESDLAATWLLPTAPAAAMPAARPPSLRSLRNLALFILAGAAVVALWLQFVAHEIPGFATVLDFKVMLATVVLLLAATQVVTAALMYGLLRPRGLSGDGAAFVHRWSGRALLIAAALVTTYCVKDIGPQSSPTRVAVHTALGSTVFLVVALKLVLLRAVPRLGVLVPLLGIAAALMFVGLWATSALPALRGSTHDIGSAAAGRAYVTAARPWHGGQQTIASTPPSEIVLPSEIAHA